MKLDTFLDPFRNGAKIFTSRRSERPSPARDAADYYSGSSTNGNTAYYEHYLNSDRHATGFLSNAQNLILQNPIMTNHQTNNMFSIGKTVLEVLHPYTMPGAAVDSSARDPPPKCHPGTRIRIMSRFEIWLDDPNRDWEMLWLYGPAGSGKSAIGQTFAELCDERNRLGAAYFFSRLNHRDRPETIIPTLAYQLAFHCEAYKLIIAQSISNDPQLLHKALHVQFTRLIVQPFIQLQELGHESIKKPFLVILDGLDECNGIRAQCDLIKMIGEHVRLRRGFPILWLICSRPEAHITHTFSRLPECIREKLELDEECHDDVERFVRDEFANIRDEYRYMIPSRWPSDEQMHIILRFFSALFVAASVGLKYVNNPEAGNPVKRLENLISFIGRSDECEGTNPFTPLDLLYTQILAEVPDDDFPITMQILSFLLVVKGIRDAPSAQALCNILQHDQGTFYTALHKLHSVANIPPPEDALDKEITFYHTSFGDFLLDSDRSGRFWISKKWDTVEFLKIALSWYRLDVTRSNGPADGREIERGHCYKCLPGLSWPPSTSTQNHQRIMNQMISFSYDWAELAFDCLFDWKETDDALLSQVYNTDLVYLGAYSIMRAVNWINSQNPSSAIVRTEPATDVDFLLLKQLEILTGGDRSAKPIGGPPMSFQDRREVFTEYFFFENSIHTVLIVAVGHHEGDDYHFTMLYPNSPLSEDDINLYYRAKTGRWA